MPVVNGKKYPYTAAGKAAAERAEKRKNMPSKGGPAKRKNMPSKGGSARRAPMPSRRPSTRPRRTGM